MQAAEVAKRAGLGWEDARRFAPHIFYLYCPLGNSRSGKSKALHL